jgi:hypothetical protein
MRPSGPEGDPVTQKRYRMCSRCGSIGSSDGKAAFPFLPLASIVLLVGRAEVGLDGLPGTRSIRQRRQDVQKPQGATPSVAIDSPGCTQTTRSDATSSCSPPDMYCTTVRDLPHVCALNYDIIVRINPGSCPSTTIILRIVVFEILEAGGLLIARWFPDLGLIGTGWPIIVV